MRMVSPWMQCESTTSNNELRNPLMVCQWKACGHTLPTLHRPIWCLKTTSGQQH
jgi:hypothetical protein